MQMPVLTWVNCIHACGVGVLWSDLRRKADLGYSYVKSGMYVRSTQEPVSVTRIGVVTKQGYGQRAEISWVPRRVRTRSYLFIMPVGKAGER